MNRCIFVLLTVGACNQYTHLPAIGLDCLWETRILPVEEVSGATGFSGEEAVAAFGTRSGTITFPHVDGAWEGKIEPTAIAQVTEIVSDPGNPDASCNPGESWLHVTGGWDFHVAGVAGEPGSSPSSDLDAFADGRYEIGILAFFDPTMVPDLSTEVLGVEPGEVESLQLSLSGPSDAGIARLAARIPQGDPSFVDPIGEWTSP